MAWFGDCLTVGDEEFVYYCGYSEGHKIGKRQLGLGSLRKNGFVSLDAGQVSGSLRTPAVKIEASGTTVNARVDGELRVRIEDEQGKPIQGFDLSAPMRGDAVAQKVPWKGTLASLKGRIVQLEFSLRRGELHGFDLH